MKNFKNYRLKSEDLKNVIGGAPQEILDSIATEQQPDEASDWAFVTLGNWGKGKDDKNDKKDKFTFSIFGSKNF